MQLQADSLNAAAKAELGKAVEEQDKFRADIILVHVFVFANLLALSAWLAVSEPIQRMATSKT